MASSKFNESAASRRPDHPRTESDNWAARASEAKETAIHLLGVASQLSELAADGVGTFSHLTFLGSRMLAAADTTDRGKCEAITVDVLAVIHGAIAAGGISLTASQKTCALAACDALEKLDDIPASAVQPAVVGGARDAGQTPATKSAGTSTAPEESLPPSAVLHHDRPSHLFQPHVWHAREAERAKLPGHAVMHFTGLTRDVASGCRRITQLLDWDEGSQEVDPPRLSQHLLSPQHRSDLSRYMAASLEMLDVEAERCWTGRTNVVRMMTSRRAAA